MRVRSNERAHCSLSTLFINAEQVVPAVSMAAFAGSLGCAERRETHAATVRASPLLEPAEVIRNFLMDAWPYARSYG